MRTLYINFFQKPTFKVQTLEYQQRIHYLLHMLLQTTPETLRYRYRIFQFTFTKANLTLKKKFQLWQEMKFETITQLVVSKYARKCSIYFIAVILYPCYRRKSTL